MLHFNRNDIHEWNISKEAFDAMVKDYGFKVDESKISMDALYTNAVANLRNDSEKTFKFLKQEKDTPMEIRDRSFEEKTKMENFFTNALMIEVAKLIDEKAVKIQVHAQHLKRAYLEFNDYMSRKSQEEQSKLQANLSLQEAGMRLMQERQAALDAYLDAAGNKLSNLDAQANALRDQWKMLEQQRKDIAKQMAKNIASEIDELRDEKGQPYLQGVPQEQKEEFYAEVVSNFAEIEVQAEKEIEKVKADIVEIDARLTHLEKQVQGEKGAVPFQANNGSLGSLFTGKIKTLPLQEQIAELKEKRATLVEYVDDMDARILRDQQAAIKAAAEKLNLPADSSIPSVEVIKSTKAYQADVTPLKEVTIKQDANVDAQLTVQNQKKEVIEGVQETLALAKQSSVHAKEELKNLDKLIQLEEQMAKMMASMNDNKAEVPLRRVHASH